MKKVNVLGNVHGKRLQNDNDDYKIGIVTETFSFDVFCDPTINVSLV